MLRHRIRDLEERIGRLNRDDLLDELDEIISALDPADPMDLDMSSVEIEFALNMLEDRVEQDERIQELRGFENI